MTCVGKVGELVLPIIYCSLFINFLQRRLFFPSFLSSRVGGCPSCRHVPRVLRRAADSLVSRLITGWVTWDCDAHTCCRASVNQTTTTTTCACIGKIQGSTVVPEGVRQLEDVLLFGGATWSEIWASAQVDVIKAGAVLSSLVLHNYFKYIYFHHHHHLPFQY
jgi:hypothetical protein